jgi:hypothetical protein
METEWLGIPHRYFHLFTRWDPYDKLYHNNDEVTNQPVVPRNAPTKAKEPLLSCQ